MSKWSLSNEDLLLLLGQVVFEYVLHSMYFLLLPSSFTYIKIFFLAIPIKWCFWWCCWWQEFFSVFFRSWIHIRSHHPCNRHWSRITVLRTTSNESLFEIEWSEVMLIWWSVQINIVRSFLKFSFLISLFKRFALWFQLHWKNCPFSIFRYDCGSTILFFFCFSSL